MTIVARISRHRGMAHRIFHRIGFPPALVLAVMFGALALPARAATTSFTFLFTSSVFTASGTLQGTNNNDGTYTITSLSGTQDGLPMTLLAPDGFYGNDNLLRFPGNPRLNGNGLSWSAGTEQVNLYWVGSGFTAFTFDSSTFAST